MTKKEIEDGIWSKKEINTIGKVEAQNAIDMMQDAFNSRLCENCKHYFMHMANANLMQCKNHHSAIHQCTVPADFGCNKFEKAQK